MPRLLQRLAADESGASATEYAILLAFVGLAVFAALGVFPAAMSGLFNHLTSQMAGWVS